MEVPDRIDNTGMALCNKKEREKYYNNLPFNPILKIYADPDIFNPNDPTASIKEEHKKISKMAKFEHILDKTRQAGKKIPHSIVPGKEREIKTEGTFRQLPLIAKIWKNCVLRMEAYLDHAKHVVDKKNKHTFQCLACKQKLRGSSMLLHFEGVHEKACPCGKQTPKWADFMQHKKICNGRKQSKSSRAQKTPHKKRKFVEVTEDESEENYHAIVPAEESQENRKRKEFEEEASVSQKKICIEKDVQITEHENMALTLAGLSEETSPASQRRIDYNSFF